MSYIKIHLKLDKSNFIPAGTGLIVEQPCNYDHFKALMTRVGAPSNWNQREDYQIPEKEQELKDKFNTGACQLWVYKHEDDDIGFCQVAQVEDLTRLFTDTSGVVEMYKMGLFPEHVGKGLGRGYVTSVLTELFNRYDTVYLNTRSTNTVNSVPFWESFGFEVIKTELLPDDLVF